LPKVKETRLSHHVLLKGKNGFSLTVLSTGRVSACRVWVGVAPPSPTVEGAGAPVDVAPKIEQQTPVAGDRP
jgi:hypothetical protein